MSSMSEYTIVGHFNLKLGATYETKQLCDVVTEVVPKTANVQKCDYFDLFMMAYSLNFVVANEMLYRTAIDILLNEAPTILKGQTPETLLCERPVAANKYNRPFVFAEFPISYFDQRTRRLYSGRVDYGSELICRTSRSFVKRLFYSCLMVYEAKREGRLGSAKGQILGYMSCV